MNILIALNLVKMHFGSNEPDGRQARMLPRIASFAPAAMAFVPRQAWAHIKWFAPYDVTAQPAPVDVVLSTHFVLVLLGFGILVFAGFFFDRLLATRSRRLTGKLLDTDLGEVLMRAGIGGFFMALFVTGGMILTPELHTDAEWIGWVQLGITISLLSRWTCVLGGAGILIPYSYGIAQYGVFHMVDYPMFPGIAAYLVLTSNMSERLRSVRMPILTVSVCTGLMWGAIEKFAYPQWTIPLLEARPYLTMGVAPKDVMIIAGFIEFFSGVLYYDRICAGTTCDPGPHHDFRRGDPGFWHGRCNRTSADPGAFDRNVSPWSQPVASVVL
jgi:hypothetical protein